MSHVTRVSKRFRLPLGLLLATSMVAGCNLIFGTGDIDYSATAGSGGNGPTTTSSSSGGNGTTSSVGGMSTSTAGGGGTAPCMEGDTMGCYSGPANTREVGACQDGTATCDADGAWGACMGDVVPAAEDCYSATDLDCDGAARCLDSAGLVSRYFIDEAASGTAPQALVDSGPAPAADLDASYAGSMAFTEEDGSRALHWDSIGENGIFVSPVSAKLMGAVGGGLTATIEVVARIATSNAIGSRLFFVGFDQVGDDLSLVAKPDRFEFRSNDYTITKTFTVVHPTTWAVYHLVVDRGAPAADRHRLYVDGLPINTTVDPLDVTPLDIKTTDNVAVGNRDVLLRTIDGSIGYVAVYDEAFSSARIDLHREVLSVSHDTNNTPHQP